MPSSLESEESNSPHRALSLDGDPLLPSDPLAEDQTPVIPFVEGQHLTPRAVIVGLLIGTLACFSNSYFGLQTGWISMMSLPLSLVGFAVFKAISKELTYPFSVVENVLVQTVAVAVGTMPLAAGLVGIIPALEKLLLPQEGGPLQLSWVTLLYGAVALPFLVCSLLFLYVGRLLFGRSTCHFVSLLIRLRFPSGHATATVISVLHDRTYVAPRLELSWHTKINSLMLSFAFSSVYVRSLNGN